MGAKSWFSRSVWSGNFNMSCKNNNGLLMVESAIIAEDTVKFKLDWQFAIGLPSDKNYLKLIWRVTIVKVGKLTTSVTTMNKLLESWLDNFFVLNCFSICNFFNRLNRPHSLQIIYSFILLFPFPKLLKLKS